MHFEKLFKQEIVCSSRCGNYAFFVSEANNGDDIREGFIPPFNPNQKFRRKI
jgi:hypothetical protein